MKKIALFLVLFSFTLALQADQLTDDQPASVEKPVIGSPFDVDLTPETSSKQAVATPTKLDPNVYGVGGEKLSEQPKLFETKLPWEGDKAKLSKAEGERIVALLVRHGGRELVQAITNMPIWQLWTTLDVLISNANPGLGKNERNLLRSDMLSALIPYKTALPWVPSAGQEAFDLLPQDVRQNLATRMLPEKLSPWRVPEFERWYQATYNKPVPQAQAERNAAYAAYYYNEVLSPTERMSLSCMSAKLSSEGLWDAIKSINYIGDAGVILFTPTGGQSALKKTLKGKGYGDWWAASKDHPWGMRDHERGVQFHIRGSDNDDTVNIHIDLYNPGDPPGKRTGWLRELPGAINHYFKDLRGWEKNHTPSEVLEHLEKSGIKVPRPK